MKENPKAFVLMPFDPEFTAIYDDLIKLALEEAGYDVKRADSLIDLQNILCTIIQGISEANLVVAELTTLNPNVLYELGLCHGLQIPTILITQSLDEVPFDLRPYKILVYSTHFDKVKKLKHDLKEIGEKHKNQVISFGSPVIDFYSGSHMPTRKTTESFKEQLPRKMLDEIQEEKGFLDLVVEGGEAVQKLSIIMLDIAKLTKDMGEATVGHTAQFAALAEDQGLGSAAKMRKVLSEAAADITQYSQQIEGYIPDYEYNVNIFIERYSKYISLLEPKTSKGKEDVKNFRDTITTFLEGIKNLLENFNNLRNSVIGLQGTSMELNRASRRFSQALDELNTATEKIKAFCVRSLALIAEKLKS